MLIWNIQALFRFDHFVCFCSGRGSEKIDLIATSIAFIVQYQNVTPIQIHVFRTKISFFFLKSIQKEDLFLKSKKYLINYES